MQRLLPPLLVVLLLAAVYALNLLLPTPNLVPSAWRLLAAMPLAAGVGLLLAARVQFLRARTNIHTFRAPDRLVTGGVFRISRNPMYLGFLLVLVAAAWWAGSLVAFASPALFLGVANFWYIPYEEAMLRRAFADEWKAYCHATRRWL